MWARRPGEVALTRIPGLLTGRFFSPAHPPALSKFPWDLAVAKSFGFRGMPYTVVLSRQGEIARKFVGPVSKADLSAVIDALLNQ